MQTVRVGPKHKHVEVPDGWAVVKSGPVRKDDMFVDLRSYKFSPVDEDDLQMDAGDFDCLVRKVGFDDFAKKEHKT